MLKKIFNRNIKDIQIVVMGPKGCGKTFFLEKLIQNQSEKKKMNNFVEACSYFNVNYKDYKILFIEAQDDDERTFNTCIELGSISDGIILMYQFKYDFPKKYFENIFKSIMDKRKEIEDKDKKPITFFLLQNYNSEITIKDSERLLDNNEAYINFLNKNNVIFLQKINEVVNYKEIIKKIIKSIEDKKSKDKKSVDKNTEDKNTEDKNPEDNNPEDKKKKKGKISGIFNFQCYSK